MLIIYISYYLNYAKMLKKKKKEGTKPKCKYILVAGLWETCVSSSRFLYFLCIF